MPSELLNIRRGRVLLFHLYAVADALDLDQLRREWGEQTQTAPLIPRRPAPQYIQFTNPPLATPLGDRPLNLARGRTPTGHVRVKIFDYGVVSVVWEFPAPSSWAELFDLTTLISDSPLVEPQSRQILEDLMPRLTRSATNLYASRLVEDYVITYVQEFSEPVSAAEFQATHRTALAQLMRGERAQLAPSEEGEALRQQISYYSDDLVVVDWNMAFIYDRAGSTEHVDILEFANSELVELRHYDRLLDRELDRIYQAVGGAAARPLVRPWHNPYQNASTKLMALMVDVVEVTERVENSLKIIGDLYSARVYRAIASRLRLREWEENIDQKLKTAQQIYSVIIEQVNTMRFLVMEIIIVILIVIETVVVVMPPRR